MVFYYYRPVSPISNSGTKLCGLAVALLFCILTSRHPPHELTQRLFTFPPPSERSDRQNRAETRTFIKDLAKKLESKSALLPSPFEFPPWLTHGQCSIVYILCKRSGLV